MNNYSQLEKVTFFDAIESERTDSSVPFDATHAFLEAS